MIKKVRDTIKEVEADGWYLVAIEGSHRQYKHPTKKGRVTINGHPGDDMDHALVRSIHQQMKGR